MKRKVIISKDAMCTDYLPVYGNKKWNTPNIDDLAKKGTVFHNHYTVAPSTVMAFYAMAIGNFPYETKYEMYERVHEVVDEETLFSKLRNDGYECHIIWDEEWMVLFDYYDYFKDDVKIHALTGLRQGVGSHYIHEGFLKQNDKKKQLAWDVLKQELDKLFTSNNDIFLWIHFPHVINGFDSYGSDIEMFDSFVGLIRNYVSDDSIIITADHGNQNGHKGKIGYGYDVYQESIRIPLITPIIGGISNYYENTCNIDLLDIIKGVFPDKRKFIYSDTAYRAQKHRRLAIIYDHYKYVFDKKTGSESLFDLDFDPHEEFSIMDDYIYDHDRKIKAPSRELYYYPDWEGLPAIRLMFQDEKNRIWKNGSLMIVLKSDLKDLIRPLYSRLFKRKS